MKSKPLIIGVTGGIGSGKTTVVNLFKDLGVPVYIADDEAKLIMVKDKTLVKLLVKNFGPDVYTDHAELNRDYLAKIVFRNREKLDLLNSIVHPAVKNHFKEWLVLQSHYYVIYESALIFETKQQDFFDDIILVTAPISERIKRLKKRNNFSEKEIRNRINKQMSDDLKRENVKYIIENIDISHLKEDIFNVNAKILNNIL